MDLYVLGCPENNLTISIKCLSVCLPMCLEQKFWSKCSSRTNTQILMKFHIQCYPNVNRCLSTFDENLSTGGTVISLFSEIFGVCRSQFLVDEIAQKFLWKIYIIRNNNDAIWVHIVQGESCYSVFSKTLVLVLSRILLYGIVQNFACIILILRDNIDIDGVA